MATHFIPARNAAPITRAAFLARFPNVFISDDEVAEGKTSIDANDLGVDVGSDVVWVAFVNNVMVTMSSYGGSCCEAAYVLGSTLNVQMFSEHDDEFDYHNFAVDVNTATPLITKGDWVVYSKEGYAWLYNKRTNSFYSYIEREVADVNIDEMIAET